MKIAYASDVHNEFHKSLDAWLPALGDDVDVLVLAGDIDIGDKTIETVGQIAQRFADVEVVWIAGNHEYYRQDYDTQLAHFQGSRFLDPRVHFLENSHIDIQGWRFIGCTLWTAFDCRGSQEKSESMLVAEQAINDFHLIRKGERFFLPMDVAEVHQQSRAWLEQALAESDPEKTVVVSHFPPSLVLNHPAFALSPVSSYFVAGVDDLLERFQPSAWIYGHNHWSTDTPLGKTRMVSNQLGYPGEQCNCSDPFSFAEITL